MSVTSETSPSPEQQLPFPVHQFDPSVFETYDRDQIADLVVETLTEKGINPDEIVLCGFDASEVVRNSSFGERTTAFAAGIAQTTTDDRYSAVSYMESDGGDKPAIAAFWLNKLRGSIQDYGDESGLYDEVTPDVLKAEHDKYIHWITADGNSLDTATAELLLF